MNIANLNGNAAFLFGKRFRKCRNKNLQCQMSNFALELITSAVQYLQSQSDKGLIVFTISNYVIIVLDYSTLYIVGHEFAG